MSTPTSGRFSALEAYPTAAAGVAARKQFATAAAQSAIRSAVEDQLADEFRADADAACWTYLGRSAYNCGLVVLDHPRSHFSKAHLQAYEDDLCNDENASARRVVKTVLCTATAIQMLSCTATDIPVGVQALVEFTDGTYAVYEGGGAVKTHASYHATCAEAREEYADLLQNLEEWGSDAVDRAVQEVMDYSIWIDCIEYTTDPADDRTYGWLMDDEHFIASDPTAPDTDFIATAAQYFLDKAACN